VTARLLRHTDGMAAVDVLSTGVERPPRRRWPVLAAGLVVALAAGAVGYADHVRRAHETERLVACVRAADDVSGWQRGRVSGMAEYIRPALREGTPPETITGLYVLVAETAGQAAAAAAPARRDCAAVPVLPWHDGQERARVAVLDYLDLELALFRASAADGAAYFAADPDLVGARERVSEALAAIGATPSTEP
jgi:hypothetical protein